MAKPITEDMVRRLNALMCAIQTKPQTIKELYGEVGLGRRSMLTHVRALLEAGKIVCVENPSDRRNKVYRLAQGAMPFKFEPKPVPEPKEPKKRGPKPAKQRPVRTEAEQRKIKTVPAQQVGIPRDPLIAAFFGQFPI